MAARPNDRSSRAGNQQSTARPPNPDRDNHYQLLNVPYGASAADITRSYRETIKRFHPDRVRADQRAAAEDLCKDLNEAYRVLSNPVSRVAYDRTIRAQEVQDQIMKRYVGGFAGPSAGGIDPYGSKLKRPPTPAEQRDRRRSDRSAFISLLSVFLVITLGVIGLILVGGLVSFLFRQVF